MSEQPPILGVPPVLREVVAPGAGVLRDADVSAAFDAKAVEPPEYWFGERNGVFWLKNEAGAWVCLKEGSFVRHLEKLGWRSFCDRKGGDVISQVARIIEGCEMARRVFYAGPLAGWRAGIYLIEGERVLVTRSPQLIAPKDPRAWKDEEGGMKEELGGEAAESPSSPVVGQEPASGPAPLEWEDIPVRDTFGAVVARVTFERVVKDRATFGENYGRGWPVLEALVWGGLVDGEDGVDQRVYFFGILAHVLAALHGGYHVKNLAMAAAGEVESGKTLLFVSIVQELAGKKSARPYSWMIGDDNFNEELFEAVLLVIDDEQSDTKAEGRQNFKQKLKQLVATGAARCRGLHTKALTLTPTWLPVICLNLEPENLLVLPPMDDDIADKIALFKMYRRPMPMAVGTEAEKQKFWETLVGELPYFSWWLLNEFALPADLRGRFGVKPYHHPEVLRELQELSQEMRLWQFIERVVFTPKHLQSDGAGGWQWRGQAMDLETLLKADHAEGPKLTRREAEEVPKAGWLGRRLGRLEKMLPGRVQRERQKGADKSLRFWILRPAPVAAATPEGASAPDGGAREYF
jgi:hypothetical protein